MDIRPIENATDYRRTLAEIDRLMDLDDDPTLADRLKVLAVLAEAWQREQHPIRPAKPIEALRAAIEDRGISRSDLARAIGSESKVSEVLAGKRGLSLTMVAALHREFRIPLRSLIDVEARPKPRGTRGARGSAARRSSRRSARKK